MEDYRHASGTHSLGKVGKHLLTSAAGLLNDQCEPDLRLLHGKVGSRGRTSRKVDSQGKTHELVL